MLHLNLIPIMQKPEYFENQIIIMAFDALAPCVARSSAAVVSIMQDKQILVFHEKGS